MKIAFIGLGKLGLPVALAVESRGHEVFGYDINPAVADFVKHKRIPYAEVQVPELLQDTSLVVHPSIEEVVAQDPDIVFVAVQTPHDPRYEGVTRLPEERVDFDYTFLKQACSDLFQLLTKPTVVAVVSTVLPGTMEREIMPMANENVQLVYTPQFIAMGTTVQDFLNPEFTLIGVDDAHAAEVMQKFFEGLTGQATFVTSVRNAEGIKVFYNTFITMKTVFGNMIGEMAARTQMDADEIYAALSMADQRLISPKYLKAGVGDGGGCHPRDNIALSWLARDVGLSFDLFEALMIARERHMGWIADVVADYHFATGRPVVVWGKSFKRGTNITVGSPATLLVNLLKEQTNIEPVAWWDPHVRQVDVHAKPHPVGIYVIATDHGDWPPAPTGSVVIDPFGTYPETPGVYLVRLGRSQPENNPVPHFWTD